MSVTTFFIRARKRDADAAPSPRFHYGARLVGTAFLFPTAAILCTVIFFLAVKQPLRPWAPPAGLAAAALLCAFAALFCRFVEPEHGIPTSYAELLQRLKRLQALVDSLSVHEELQNAAAYIEVAAQLDDIAQALGRRGMQWLMGHGYTDAWARFHRAEEAVMEIAPLQYVYEEAEYDELRLLDSGVPNRDALMVKLHKAQDTIRAAAGGVANGSLPLARGTLRNVRRAINEYRDQRWNGLIVARNRLFETCALTALVFFAIVATAIANDATYAQMIAASFFCAIGAAVGLAKRLRDDSRADSAAIDEGLSAARLITIPLFSGFAAVCGVPLMAVVPLAAKLTLASVFTVSATNFLVAAVFGLAPDLLFDGLQQRADKFKKDLSSSQAAGKS